jgi:cell cycle checkpoint protein
MPQPPAKKQKRLAASSSDTQNEGLQEGISGLGRNDGIFSPQKESRSPFEGGYKALTTISPPESTKPEKGARAGDAKESTPTPSPEKLKKATPKKPKNGSLYSFFNAVTHTQTQLASEPFKSQQSSTPESDIVENDTIQDESDNDTGEAGSRSAHRVSLPDKRAIHGSQKFSIVERKGLGEAGTSPTKANIVPDRRPWAERYAPDSVDELAVHKKKVSDVRSWLESVLRGRERKVRISL